MTVDQYIEQYSGKHIDEDGYYGAQCWDVVAKYSRKVHGCPSFPTGSGGAEGLYRIFANPIGQYFTRVKNEVGNPNQLPKKGDIVVWSKDFYQPWGHTALVLSATSSGMTVMEQNGGNPGGVAYIKNRGWSKVSGWLTPKTGGSSTMSKTDLSIARILAHGLLGRLDAHSGASDRDLNKNHVGQETNAKIWQFFKSSEGVNWRNRIPRLVNAEKNAVNLGNALKKSNTELQAIQKKLAEMGERPTQKQLDDLNKAVTVANQKAIEAQTKIEELTMANEADSETADTFMRQLGKFLTKYLPFLNSNKGE